MTNIEQLQEKFCEAQKNYKSIKKDTEQQVVKWFWATDSIFSLEPFYFEENHFPKGKLHKDEPLKKENQYQYGIDTNNEIVVERQFTGVKDLFYEIFYIRKDDRIDSYRFDYSVEKEIENVELFIYEHSILTMSYAFYKDGWIKYIYIYNKGKLSTKTMQRIYQNKEVPDRIFDYHYDEIGILKAIKEKEHYWYHKPNNTLSYKKLTDLVSEKLLEILKEHILNYNIREKIYCIYVYYYHEDTLPPSIGFGTETDREEWQNEKGKEAKWIIWNPIDYSHNLEIDLNEETENLFNLYNQETSLKNKESNTIKMIIECCKNVKDSISEFEINKTDDFVIVASDYEQSDLKKNFKLINPELFYEFKNKLV